VKKIILTRHAETKMLERGIQLDWIERTIRNPQWTEPEPRDPFAERRFAPVPEFGSRMLRVVCVETESAIRVITATFDRGARSGR
jgi:hypothetical protein